MVSLQAALAALALSGVGQTVLLDFYSDTCGPCRAMDPTIRELAAKYPVRKVNVAENPALAAEYRVENIPCYVMLVNGREVDRVVGGTTFSRLERMCKLALGQPLQDHLSPELAQATPPRSMPPVSVPAVESRGAFSAAPQPDSPAAADPRLPASGWSPQSREPAAPDAALTNTGVRLRVEDARGHSCGSGTIIDAREGQALILTCGHIFRESQGKGRIEVDLFGVVNDEARNPNDELTTANESFRHSARVSGRLISYSLERDVALVAVRIPGPVAAARVAPAGYRVAPGAPVLSVGCNHGNPPSARRSRVTSLDKFLGPPNLQVAGQSVEGRSGGGLFSSDGLVIGVCNAADPSDDEALYAALGAVHAELDQAGLSFVYQPQEEDPVARTTSPAPRASLAAMDPPPPMPERMPPPSDPSPPDRLPVQPVSAPVDDSPRLNATEQAALDEIRRRLQEGAEVICVVRSRRDPRAKSEIIMLDKVSPQFLKQLAAEAGARGSHDLVPTLLEIPRSAQPPGSWAAGAEGWRPRTVEPAAGR